MLCPQSSSSGCPPTLVFNAAPPLCRYMGWLLKLGDVEKSRALAQRALDTINYRCEIKGHRKTKPEPTCLRAGSQ